jgi:hypothetical protein
VILWKKSKYPAMSPEEAYAKYGRPGGILTASAKLTDEQLDQIVAAWRRIQNG